MAAKRPKNFTRSSRRYREEAGDSAMNAIQSDRSNASVHACSAIRGISALPTAWTLTADRGVGDCGCHFASVTLVVSPCVPGCPSRFLRIGVLPAASGWPGCLGAYFDAHLA